MTQEAGKSVSRKMRIATLFGWAIFVAGGVYELVAHPQRITGFRGFMTWLGIAVGCLWIVKAIKDLVEEPQ
jgi:hypothetical protein